MQRRYYVKSRVTAWRNTVWQVIDRRYDIEVLDRDTEAEAAKHAGTLNSAYEVFIEATLAWRAAGRPIAEMRI